MEGAADAVTKATDALLQQTLGPITVILVFGIAGLFLLYRRDLATKDKALAEAKAVHLSDLKQADDRVYKALEAVSLLAKRPRGG